MFVTSFWSVVHAAEIARVVQIAETPAEVSPWLRSRGRCEAGHTVFVSLGGTGDALHILICGLGAALSH